LGPFKFCGGQKKKKKKKKSFGTWSLTASILVYLDKFWSTVDIHQVDEGKKKFNQQPNPQKVSFSRKVLLIAKDLFFFFGDLVNQAQLYFKNK